MTFKEEYEERARSGNYRIINQAYKLYDVLWVLALALNNTNAMIDSGDINGTGCEGVPGSLVPCLLYTSPSPRDATLSRMPSSA